MLSALARIQLPTVDSCWMMLGRSKLRDAFILLVFSFFLKPTAFKRSNE